MKRLPVVPLLVASALAVCTEPTRLPDPASQNIRGILLDSTRSVETMLIVEDVAERVAPSLNAGDQRDLLIERLRDVRRALAVRDRARTRSALDAARRVLDRRLLAARDEQKPDLAAIQLALDDVERLLMPRQEQP